MTTAIRLAISSFVFVAAVAVAPPARAAAWFPCGTLTQLDSATCQLRNYSSTSHEYGIAYNSTEPLPVVCTSWNYGQRIYNKEPFLVYSDNPAGGMRRGGFVFYTDTLATDDDTCPSGNWRHKYWSILQDGNVSTADSNGCYNQTIYCRVR